MMMMMMIMIMMIIEVLWICHWVDQFLLLAFRYSLLATFQGLYTPRRGQFRPCKWRQKNPL